MAQMPSDLKKLLMGVYFYPRGGSAHVSRALAREFGRSGFEVTLLSGSRSDLGEHAQASRFYAGLDLRTVDFTPALRSVDPTRDAMSDSPAAGSRARTRPRSRLCSGRQISTRSTRSRRTSIGPHRDKTSS